MSNWRDPTEGDLGPQESNRDSKSRSKPDEKQSFNKGNTFPKGVNVLLITALIFLNIFLVIKLFFIEQRLYIVQQQVDQLQQRIKRMEQEGGK
jgi:cell division protein FtsL